MLRLPPLHYRPDSGYSGSYTSPSGRAGRQRIAEELAARFADMNEAPTILANLSNIGWFGDTIAVNQHLIISRMRSLELQRPMLRATNTGATVVIDHHGVVTHSVKPFTQGVLDAEVQGRQGLTPYAWWASRFGLWPLLIVAVVLMLLTLPLRRRE